MSLNNRVRMSATAIHKDHHRDWYVQFPLALEADLKRVLGNDDMRCFIKVVDDRIVKLEGHRHGNHRVTRKKRKASKNDKSEFSCWTVGSNSRHDERLLILPDCALAPVGKMVFDEQTKSIFLRFPADCPPPRKMNRRTNEQIAKDNAAAKVRAEDKVEAADLEGMEPKVQAVEESEPTRCEVREDGRVWLEGKPLFSMDSWVLPSNTEEGALITITMPGGGTTFGYKQVPLAIIGRLLAELEDASE